MVFRLILLALVLTATATARPDEASGVVLKVIDGETFEVQGFGLVRLADIDCPKMDTIEGVHAREYALENLLGAQVFLDVDNDTGRSSKDATSCVAYLANPNGTPNLNENFNKMIAKAGYATIRKDTRSEFDPARW
jgi:micrococcal nuclease